LPDVSQPFVPERVHPAFEGFSQEGGQPATFLVTGDICSGYHRAQVTQGDLIGNLGRGFCPVPPFGGLEARQQVLRHADQGLSVWGWTAFGGGLFSF
jgi:hypothetical protein